jgi:D-xylulose reductase
VSPVGPRRVTAPVRALVLERRGELALREIDLPQDVGPDDVKVAIDTVGVCGSDVHYYTHGRIGPFVVEAPMVLGHEAAGVVTETGANVRNLAVGDRVCMEPGVPDLASRAARLGLYNVDPAVRFWATPPVHGVLTGAAVHPAAFTYKLPDNVSFAEGALVEPFAIGMQAAARARITPGDTAVVIGCGPIGIMVALAALAGGCAAVIISDFSAEKLAIAGGYDGIIPVNIGQQKLAEVVAERTRGWGADIVFEASGSPKAYADVFSIVRPGGALVLIGLPVEPVAFDVPGAIAKEVRIETVFRYANIFDRALAVIASGKLDFKRLITATYAFADSIAAFERAAAARPGDVKIQIKLA